MAGGVSLATGALASAGSGGVLGLLGSVVGGFFRGREAREQRERLRMEYDQELALQKLQIEAGKAETERDLAVANLDGSWRNLETSMKAEMAATASSGWVRDVKALFRPFLTLLLVMVTATLLFVLLTGRLEAAAIYLDHAALSELVSYTVSSTVFTTSTAVAWWFGDRSLSPPQRK